MKPKNDDSSESSSIKDSGYEEPENDGITKNNKRSSDSKKKIKPDKGSLGTVTSYLKTEKQEEEQSPPPVFKLQEINSIWASCDLSDEAEEREKTIGDHPLGISSPGSARTTIIG